MMREDDVRQLTEAEYRQVWDQFYSRFDFRPSIHRFPGIAEPHASMTWSLEPLHGGQVDRLVSIVYSGLASAANPGEQLWLLDWQHTCYRLPATALDHAQTGLSPYPDGDYYIYLASDLRYGSFGHPWEQTLCLFGEPLLRTAAAEVSTVLGPPIRIGGQKQTDQEVAC
jgi:hypothetical protein